MPGDRLGVAGGLPFAVLLVFAVAIVYMLAHWPKGIPPRAPAAIHGWRVI